MDAACPFPGMGHAGCPQVAADPSDAWLPRPFGQGGVCQPPGFHLSLLNLWSQPLPALLFTGLQGHNRGATGPLETLQLCLGPGE